MAISSIFQLHYTKSPVTGGFENFILFMNVMLGAFDYIHMLICAIEILIIIIKDEFKNCLYNLCIIRACNKQLILPTGSKIILLICLIANVSDEFCDSAKDTVRLQGKNRWVGSKSTHPSLKAVSNQNQEIVHQ